MAETIEGIYKVEIEALSDHDDFEALGDERYLTHFDNEARLLWAFYRPSGSHPLQVSDEDPRVAIMAFNHSRLGAYERFSRLNPVVITTPQLRHQIRNRSRMLFRALVDNDFTELVAVLEKFPLFMEQACDQMIHGRIWNETYARLDAATKFIIMAQPFWNDTLHQGVLRRLPPLERMNFDQCKEFFLRVCHQAQELHCMIRDYYAQAMVERMKDEDLHPLQRLTIEKKIQELKG